MVDIIINTLVFPDIGVMKEHMCIDVRIAVALILRLAMVVNTTFQDNVQHIMVVQPVSLSVQPIIQSMNRELARQLECTILLVSFAELNKLNLRGTVDD